MSSSLHVFRSVLCFAALLMTVQSVPASAQSDSASADAPAALDIPQGGNLPPPPVDSGAIADAYGDLSVFILNVAAGLDGVPKNPQAEQMFHDAFAQQMADALSNLDPNDRQALAQLPALRTAVRSAWINLAPSQRSQIADQWRQNVQSQLSSVPCPMYDALARAYLLPGGDDATIAANRNQLVQCWNQYPELARDASGQDLSAQRQHNSDTLYRGLINAEVTHYAGTMNMLSIMSGDPYRWTVK